ncbi:MAG: bifunctional diaminohydroxyphosphoribosylaminopyrimidine deaminase/5-amino-6-(5-phosphoribosylamino)uracil reductase RibD [Hyphomicrobiales bacterium]|nr:bifunctional diaminohydroxyphosphoribosylaminopyrimidine deaminase/5-amino-6-(5-phosphoribosylamino)uracil reductase RibD [Hyphomicrobiales bacterium]
MNPPRGPETTIDDERWMAAALRFGRRGMGLAAPNPSVGALLVKNGVVVGRGVTSAGGRPHAETQAIREAGAAARGATLYVTLEPCSHHGATPPCAEAIITAGVARVVCAIEDPDVRVAGRGFAILRAAGIELAVGAGAAAAARDHRGHIMRVVAGRPMVTLKLARTADGYAAGDDHDPRLAITGEIANLRVQVMRTLHDAIMIGVGTALGDDPLLTVRLPGVHSRPLRVVLDTHLSLPPRSRLCETAREVPTLAIASRAASREREAALVASGVEVARVDADKTARVDLEAALKLLAQRGITRVFSEGGPRIGSRLIEAGLADEIALFTALKPLGRPGLKALNEKALAALSDAERFREIETATYGDDVLRRWERVG